MKKIVPLLFIIVIVSSLCGETINQTCSDNADSCAISDQETPLLNTLEDLRLYLKDYELSYLVSFATTLAHELGHVVAHQITTGSWQPIKMAIGEPIDEHVIFSVPNAITMYHDGSDSLDWSGVEHLENSPVSSEPTNMMTIAAGPLASMLLLYFAKLLMPHLEQVSFITPYLFIQQLLLCSPWLNNDGASIIKLFKLEPNVAHAIIARYFLLGLRYIYVMLHAFAYLKYKTLGTVIFGRNMVERSLALLTHIGLHALESINIPDKITNFTQEKLPLLKSSGWEPIVTTIAAGLTSIILYLTAQKLVPRYNV